MYPTCLKCLIEADERDELREHVLQQRPHVLRLSVQDLPNQPTLLPKSNPRSYQTKPTLLPNQTHSITL